MSAEIAHALRQRRAREATRPWRVRTVLALGPATMLAGLGWALLQPDRLTFLHPFGQGFWWLIGGQPPLYVVLAGLVFWRVVAVPLARDLE